jgi:[NiFe] hydrogenase small subunit
MADERRPRLAVIQEPLNNRREFLKLCAALAVAMGCERARSVEEVERVLERAGPRPPVLWLHFAACTGCTEGVLRSKNPWFDDLMLDVVSIEYHETLMAGAGAPVHELLLSKAEEYRGSFFAVVEGAIPTASGGVFGTVGGRTMLSVAEEICPKAQAIVTLGTCAAYGGLPAASPNLTGARGVRDALSGLTVPVVNLPGCPPNPLNFIALMVNYLLTSTLPELDAQGRPLFAYGQTNHRLCPFLNTPRCLMSQGCMGPAAHNNCPSLKFNDGASFPMQAGHPCIACSEPAFWDQLLKLF